MDSFTDTCQIDLCTIPRVRGEGLWYRAGAKEEMESLTSLTAPDPLPPPEQQKVHLSQHETHRCLMFITNQKPCKSSRASDN